MKDTPSISILKSILDYNPQTGNLTWKSVRPSMFAPGIKHSAETRAKIWNKKYSGKLALTYKEKNRPYAYGDVFGKKLYAHRVAFAIMTGRWPSVVDHIDGKKDNNSWSNLREVTTGENARNVFIKSNNTSGVTGVYFDKARDAWCAEIQVNKIKKHLGRFKTKQAAIDARKLAQSKKDFTARHGLRPVD
jgi:hypothetical protein